MYSTIKNHVMSYFTCLLMIICCSPALVYVPSEQNPYPSFAIHEKPKPVIIPGVDDIELPDQETILVNPDPSWVMPANERDYYINLIQGINQVVANNLRQCEERGELCIDYLEGEPDDVDINKNGTQPILYIGANVKNYPANEQHDILVLLTDYYQENMPLSPAEKERYLAMIEPLNLEVYKGLLNCEYSGESCLRGGTGAEVYLEYGVGHPIWHIGPEVIEMSADDIMVKLMWLIAATANDITNNERNHYMKLLKTLSPMLYQKLLNQKLAKKPYMIRDNLLDNADYKRIDTYDIISIGTDLQLFPIKEQRFALACAVASYEDWDAIVHAPEDANAALALLTDLDTRAVQKTGDIDSAIEYLHRVRVPDGINLFIQERIQHLEELKSEQSTPPITFSWKSILSSLWKSILYLFSAKPQ